MKLRFSRSSAVLALLWIATLFLSGCGAVSRSVPPQATSQPVPSTPPAPAAANPSPDPSTSPSAAPSPPSSGVPRSKHVVLVIEENHSYSEVHDGGMPWLVRQGWDYAFAANYHADAVGSALDYFWLSSGSSELDFGCGGWGCSKPITSNNIFRELNRAGLSWKVYAESLPEVGWIKGDSGQYAVRHNPAAWYSDVIDSAAEQSKMVPFTEFTRDMARDRLPDYSLVIPNLHHDAHNGTLREADQWLHSNVGPLLQQPYFRAGGDGLLIVTFDECDAAVGNCPEHIYTALIGPNVKRSYKSSQSYRHENTLRTILEALAVDGYPGASQHAKPMTDFFN
jgi:phosphatidylinositol-3-phosphatase